ncbi:hypothetical protein [Haloplasma contractile]|uniref:Uncharacterized protein n=1 Tax=Haloplasma contractile SSD-17B TaxID=1033810 RepID=U2DVA2_9MOLU|nr:hypothetical protein [Haloplasma contractile]ERJ12327.1 hypothetical protein HLPCO_001313 [Haloplasma contractile SSD-17B]
MVHLILNSNVNVGLIFKEHLIVEYFIWFLSYVVITTLLYVFYLKKKKDKLSIFNQYHVITRLILSFIIILTVILLMK